MFVLNRLINYNKFMVYKKLFLILNFIFLNLAADKLYVGICQDRGPRDYMEDRYRIINRPQTNEFFFGVFDGHGGYKVADYLANILYPTYLDKLYDFNIPDSLTKSFEYIDNSLDLKISNYQGSTSLVAVIKDEKLYVANVGDSRAVLCRDGFAIDLSIDQNISCVNEKQRIEKLGGVIYYPVENIDKDLIKKAFKAMDYLWLNGKYLENKSTMHIIGHGRFLYNSFLGPGMTRSIGDKFFKRFLIPTPEITITDILPEDEFVIMASDGIWDVLSSQLAVNFVREALNDGKNADYAAKMLADIARMRGSQDNITVIIIK